MSSALTTGTLAPQADAIAPDGSEIRLLAATPRASMVHCTLPPGGVTRAVRHRSVDELWFFLSGRGEVWRRDQSGEAVVAVGSGISLAIAQGTCFQFRALGTEPLAFIITTIPPWPGEQEALFTAGRWDPVPYPASQPAPPA